MIDPAQTQPVEPMLQSTPSQEGESSGMQIPVAAPVAVTPTTDAPMDEISQAMPTAPTDDFTPADTTPQLETLMQEDASMLEQPTLEIPQAAPAQVAQVTSAPPPAPPPPHSMQESYDSVLSALIGEGHLTQEQAENLQMDSLSLGETPVDLALERNLVSEEDLVQCQALFNKIPFIKIAEVGVDPQALGQISESVAKSYNMLPIAFNKATGNLSVAMVNPLDIQAIDFARQKTGLNILVNYATPTEIERALAENYSQNLTSEVTAAIEQSGKYVQEHTQQQTAQQSQGGTIRQAPIAKIVQNIISFAIKARASDIHIEPQETRTRVRYRIDGILSEKLVLPSTVHDGVISRIKILSGLKIDEKRTPQDGRINFAENDQEVDLRISTLPTIHGEKVVMRLLKKDDTVPTLPQLGLNGIALENLKKAIQVPHGIILVTGPTGSGKTTTLYSVLHRINTPKVNIMTLEDPVEYQMPGVNQVQINPQAGLTFSSGLRSFLRQDPNVIMVGEIRDGETSELAVQASLTGHLVFSTLHTSSAAGAIPRMLDMGAEPFLLASSITLVMAQRVMRRLNPDYKVAFDPDPVLRKDVQHVLGAHLDEWCANNNTTPETFQLYKPKKDIPQGELDYKGRIAIFEVIMVTEEIGKLILEQKPASDIEKLALKNGTLLMKQDGYLKALEGITTIEEVKRVAEV